MKAPHGITEASHLTEPESLQAVFFTRTSQIVTSWRQDVLHEPQNGNQGRPEGEPVRDRAAIPGGAEVTW